MALGLALPALAGVGVRSVPILLSPDGRANSQYPAGDAPPPTEELDWDIADELNTAGINALEVGTAFSHDVRQYLSGTEAATADINVIDVSGTAAPFADPNGGDNLVYDEVTEGSGSFRLEAVGVTGSVLSAVKSFTAVSGDPPADEPNKVVQPNGASCGAGCTTFTTIQAALSDAAAGDLIELRSNTPGTTTTRTETLLISGKNGTSASPIRVRVKTGDRYLIKNNTADPIIKFLNSSYWEFDGNGTGSWSETESEATASTRRDQLEFADIATWDPAGGGGQPGPHTNTIRCENSHHVTFTKAKLHGLGTQSKGHFIRRDCEKWTFTDVELSAHGTIDQGDLIDIYAPRSIIEKSTLRWGGHDQISGTAPYLVVRWNLMDGTWEDADASFAGEGTRIMGMSGSQHDDWSPTKGGNQHVGVETDEEFVFGPQLLERNRLLNVFPEPGGTTPDPAQKFISYRLIARGNLYADFTGPVWVGPAFGNNTVYTGDGAYPGPGQSHGYAYHNTSYDTNGVWQSNNSNFNGALHDDNESSNFRFKNNIFADLHNNQIAGRCAFWWAAPSSLPLNGHTNKWKSSQFHANIFQGDSTKMCFELGTTEGTINGTGASSAIGRWNGSGTELFGCSGAEAGICTDADTNNVSQTAALTFSNLATTPRTFASMTITGGLGLGDAPPLTETTATCSGTTVTVADNGYFYDPENAATWDMADRGEENDYIAIGATRALAALNVHQIASINSNGTGIVLKSSAICASGDGVWFAGNPALGAEGIWDNRGQGQ